MVLLGGEAGSGKSRLVREFAAEVAADGALVLYGSCDAEVRTPYGAFVEALDQLARATEPDELRAALGGGGSDLTRLLPDLGARVGGLPPAAEADPDTERHRLHTAVAELLDGITQRRPVLLVLEDVHWADAPTLLLMRHLARAGSARMLLLATFRDTEADVPDTLSETLADLRRYDSIRLGLHGLSGDEVAEFVRSAAGEDLGPALRRARAGDPRAHRRQRVPGVRALARARGDRGGGGGGRDDPRVRVAGRAGEPGERPRGGEPEAGSASRPERATCWSWRPRRGRSSSSTWCAARPVSASPSCSGRSTRPCAAG